jgi:transcriptional regulator with XRE-family HTH domain
MASVGDRIKKRRKDLGLSQQDICSRVGLSKSFFSELESGKRNVSSSNLLSIGRVLGVSLDWLMTGKEYQGVAMALEMPESLVEYSRKQKVAPKLASMMLAVQELILASKVSKGGKKKGVDLSKVDWKRVHGACKDLLG